VPGLLIGAQPFVPGRPQQVVEPAPEPVGVGSVLARLRAGRVDPGRRGALALACVAVLAAVVAGVVLLRSRPVEQPLAAPAVAASAALRAGGSGVASAPQSPSADVVVSVAGKVRRPGLVHLLAGSRVDDAVRAAGGVLPGSGPGLLNLARKLVDGEQVLVGVAAPPAAPGPASQGSAASGAPVSALDLNAATASDFDTLPGIGPVLADHLVTWRTQHGGRFASVDQVRQVSGSARASTSSSRTRSGCEGARVNEDLDLRVALPAVAAWLVAWQGRLLPPGVLALGACCVALFAALVLLRSRGPRAAVVAAVCVCAAAAGLATAARVHARRTGPLAQAARSSSSVTVEGVLTDDPRAVPPKADVLTFRQLVVAHVRVERLLVAGRDVHLREPVLILSSDEHWLGLLPSQHLSTEGRVQSPGVGDDVAALVSTRGPPRVLGAPTGLQRLAGRLRAGLRAAAGPLPGDERGLLPGLVEGDTSRLDPGLNDDFRATGDPNRGCLG